MKLTFTLALFFLSTIVFAQADKGTRRRNLNNENYIAMRQFDPVSYFKNKPLRGSEKFQYDYNGIVYYFASDENLQTFKKSPDKYEPAYGGWCAFTLATTGQRERIDPTAFKIMNGKLYLFYNFNGDNRLQKWNEHPNRKNLIILGDKKWKLR